MFSSSTRLITRSFRVNRMAKKILVAFDFDNTLIAENSDLYVRKLAPEPGLIPEDIKQLYSAHGWTEYMAAIFKYLHTNGTSREQILACMEEIEFVAGMRELLVYLLSSNADVVIISDSNSVFIDHILKSSQLDATVTKVYTNPASFDEAGCLNIAYYHTQDWCNMSSVNLCKGHILDAHVEESAKSDRRYDVVAYVGDGTNDLCPALRLSEKDLVFPRKGYRLIKEIEAAKVAAKVIPRETGFDIMDAIKSVSSNL